MNDAITNDERLRLKFHKKLCEILGSEHVYFQPPESTKIQYPAIIYSRSDIRTRFADNDEYGYHTAYKVTIVDKNPDSIYIPRIASLPLCRFNSHYTQDNLNHDVFLIFLQGGLPNG